MILATTTSDFECVSDHIQRVECLYQAGFRYVDLSMYTIFSGDPLFADGWENYALDLKAYAAERGMTFVQAHGPNVNNFKGEEGFADAVWKTRRGLEVCQLLGIPNMVVHPGWSRDVSDRETWFAENRRFYSAMFADMERCGVNILCENSTRVNLPASAYYLITGEEMRAFIDFVDHPRFGGCWDTGHANVEGNQYDEIVALGDKLYAIHFNDNRGKQDEHIIPYMGTMNVDEVMHALLDVGYKGVFTFECDSPLRPANYWLGNRRGFDRANGLANPPMELRVEMEKFMYRVGRHILTAYGLLEG